MIALYQLSSVLFLCPVFEFSFALPFTALAIWLRREVLLIWSLCDVLAQLTNTGPVPPWLAAVGRERSPHPYQSHQTRARERQKSNLGPTPRSVNLLFLWKVHSNCNVLLHRLRCLSTCMRSGVHPQSVVFTLFLKRFPLVIGRICVDFCTTVHTSMVWNHDSTW